jgi:hypothetical protein
MGHPPIHPGPNPPGGASSSSACTQLKHDIATYQALLDQLNRKLLGTQGHDERKKIWDEIAIAVRVLKDTEASYQHTVFLAQILHRRFTLGRGSFRVPTAFSSATKCG